MRNSLTGKTAIVTGGTRGIGRAIVERLLQEGLKVAFCGQSEESVLKAMGELSKEYQVRAFGKSCNVAQHRQVQEFFAFAGEKLGAIDILVNNAGVGTFAPVEELTPEQWHRMIDTNLSGVYYCCREAIPRMKAAGRRLHIQHQQPRGKECIRGRIRLQRVEIRP